LANALGLGGGGLGGLIGNIANLNACLPSNFIGSP
jgi:hypothetical protein